MSNLWLNIRILYWHLQIGEPKKYSIRIVFGDFHWKTKLKYGWFEIYAAPWIEEEYLDRGGIDEKS